MPNDRFDFKQFSIAQSGAAFKVGTDGCLLGAWANVNGVSRILDVGTGSGVIALMLAQRSNASIQAIDVDVSSVEQAKQNVRSSPWAERIDVKHAALQEFKDQNGGFDLMVCNPPFFKASTLSGNVRKDTARHEERLDLGTLLNCCRSLASNTARLCVVVPNHRLQAILQFARIAGWQRSRQLNIRPVSGKAINRSLLEFQVDVPHKVQEQECLLYDPHPLYSPQILDLLRPYYLHL
ncbi:MAG: methyltransferase [Flavobacteriales bacterium]|nr:methyltransferase [Flavobacteriales bacterium]